MKRILSLMTALYCSVSGIAYAEVRKAAELNFIKYIYIADEVVGTFDLKNRTSKPIVLDSGDLFQKPGKPFEPLSVRCEYLSGGKWHRLPYSEPFGFFAKFTVKEKERIRFEARLDGFSNVIPGTIVRVEFEGSEQKVKSAPFRWRGIHGR